MLSFLFCLFLSNASAEESTRKLIDGVTFLDPITEEYTKENRRTDFKEGFQTGWKEAKGIHKKEWIWGSAVGAGLGAPVGAFTMLTLGFGFWFVGPPAMVVDVAYLSIPAPVPVIGEETNKTIENARRIGYRSRIRAQRLMIVAGTGSIGFFGGMLVAASQVDYG